MSGNRERVLREKAKRQGLRLRKCRRRDPQAIGFGLYGLEDQFNRWVSIRRAGNPYTLDLDGVDQFLNSE